MIGVTSPLHSMTLTGGLSVIAVTKSRGEHDRISKVVNKVTEPSRSATEYHEAGVALASQRRFAEAV